MVYSGHFRMDDQTIPDLAAGTQQYRYQRSNQPSRGSKKIVIIILLLLLFAAAIFGITRFMGVSAPEVKEEVEPSPTEIIFPTDTPAPIPQESPTPEASKTPTPKPTGDPVDKATGLDRSELSVTVLNGSGKTGAAKAASDALKSLGYEIVSVGNADSENYENTTIQVKSAQSKYLDLLKKDLSATYTIGTTSADLAADASSDAVVIVGKE